ncbi:hypothetical protein Avbf_00808 [Armadillidium vulgare]|nr:hypothetical protein Avbf_00808 [Armadillidium vulgare]
MAASDKRGPSPSVSFSELPKVLSTNSYLAAALKASVTSLSSSGGRSYTETTTSPSSSPTLQIKQEPFSQQESSSHPTKSNPKQQQQHSLKSPSPGEIVNSVNSIASSLLNSDAQTLSLEVKEKKTVPQGTLKKKHIPLQEVRY